MKMLLIKTCSDQMMWYATKVGQYVPFVRECSDCYLSREDAGYINVVLKKDAVVVDTP